MVRMPELRQAAAARTEATHVRAADGLTPGDRLDRVERELASILDAQSRCAAACLRAAEAVGTRVLRWDDLTADERAGLRARCRDEIYPALTPLAMTLSPGHPLPHLPHLGLSLAVVFRHRKAARRISPSSSCPAMPTALLPVPGRALTVIPIEDVLRANVDLLYPNARVDGAYLFRVTRGGDLDLDERSADDLLERGLRRHRATAVQSRRARGGRACDAALSRASWCSRTCDAKRRLARRGTCARRRGAVGARAARPAVSRATCRCPPIRRSTTRRSLHAHPSMRRARS